MWVEHKSEESTSLNLSKNMKRVRLQRLVPLLEATPPFYPGLS